MPKNPQKIYRRSMPFMVLALFFSICIFSCKSDKKETNPSDLFNGPNTINFTINGDQLKGSDQIGKDITMMDYQEDRLNKDHVLHVGINDSIYFKDISQFKGDPPGKRQWFVDEQPLASNGREVAFYSEEVGPTVVTLKYDDYNHVRKGIYFTDEFSFEEPVAMAEGIVDEDPEVDNSNSYSEPARKEVPKVEEKPTTTSRSSNNNNNSTSSQRSQSNANSTPVAKPAPPAPVKKEITRVDFSVSKSVVEAGEKITFRDLSEPAVAIDQRVWDWGDGTTMPTRGSTAGYSYYKPGNYTVKLCLNYSSKCQTKQITVKEKAKPIVVAPPPVKPKEEKVVVKEEPKKITVSKVVISSASKTQVGKPIEITDNTFPAEAVTSRVWYVNGEKTNITKKKFSKTFDASGNYEIKLCVNGSSMCETTKITIEDKPKPPPVQTKTAVVEDEFFPMANSRTGLRSSQRCPEADSKWHEGEAELTLSPTTRLELLNARIYGQKVSQAQVTLKSSDGKITRKINNVQILPGPSTIEFGDFGIVLQPGLKYTITIKPMSGETLSLENGGSCNTSFASDDRMNVSYKENVMTLYDIKFSY